MVVAHATITHEHTHNNKLHISHKYYLPTTNSLSLCVPLGVPIMHKDMSKQVDGTSSVQPNYFYGVNTHTAPTSHDVEGIKTASLALF